MQLSLFEASERDDLIEEVFEAYFECRRNKRGTRSALIFERNFEERLFKLADDLYGDTWTPQPSTAFIVSKPVKREVFAASFSDRVVHHWLMGKLMPHFESLFIEDSYACRSGKGTLYGVRRLERFIQRAYAQDPRGAFALSLDIRGFFMSIPRERLWEQLNEFIRKEYKGNDLARVLRVAQLIAELDATKQCRIAGSPADWNGLPADKSLFKTAAGRGLPIGNLTSQVFANFYLHPLDRFVRDELAFPFYGRYVDDFFVIHPSPNRLKQAIPQIQDFLKDELSLQLHPRKVKLQHVAKGVKFLGAVVWPTHTTAGKRVKGNFYAAVREVNQSPEADADRVRQRLNSYLGLLSHHRTHRLRRRVMRKVLSNHWQRKLRVPRAMRKVLVRPDAISDGAFSEARIHGAIDVGIHF